MFTQAKEDQFSEYKLKVPDNYTEYFYAYEVGKFKSALLLSTLRNGLIQRNTKNVKNPKGFIPLRIGHRINTLSSDFKMLAHKIIKKQGIDSYEDYMSAVSSLILANSGIEYTITRMDKKARKKFEPLKKRLEKATKSWDNVNYLIQPHAPWILFMNSHFTALMVLLYAILIGLLIFGAINMPTWEYTVAYSVCAVCLFIYILVFAGSNRALPSISKTYRDNYKYSYRYFYDHLFLKQLTSNIFKR